MGQIVRREDRAFAWRTARERGWMEMRWSESRRSGERENKGVTSSRPRLTPSARRARGAQGRREGMGGKVLGEVILMWVEGGG